ncbi:MAG TPA: hypothetical protein VN783_16050, partial [Thermoanaerobaculia bacterium]|nr:hypothetical protein [Thermoanaerobaculia bacterium]
MTSRIAFRSFVLSALAVLLVLPPALRGQDFSWADGLGGTGLDAAFALAVDPDGNSYVAGTFSGVVDFDPGPGTASLDSGGRNDAFLLKLDPAGGFLWVRRVDGAERSDALGVALDALGNPVVVGSFAGLSDFDPGAGTLTLGVSGQTPRPFLWKLTAAGDLSWARDLGGMSLLSGGASGVALDGSGFVYATGSFSGLGDFDPGPGTFNLTSAGQGDLFVLKLDGDGLFQWAKRAGGSFDDGGRSLVAEPGGGVELTGTFFGTVDFDPDAGTANLTSTGVDA